MDSELLECEEEKDEELLTFPFAIHSQAIITEKIMKNHAMSFTKIFISNTTPLKNEHLFLKSVFRDREYIIIKTNRTSVLLFGCFFQLCESLFVALADV